MTKPTLRTSAASCAYCGEPFSDDHYGTARTKDHIVPKSFKLGLDSNKLDTNDMAAGRGNGVWACGRCNRLKGGMMPSQIKALACEHRRRAELLDRIADQADKLINDRRLLP